MTEGKGSIAGPRGWDAANGRGWLDRSNKLLPLAVTVLLFVILYGAGAYLFDGFLSLQVVLNLFIDNAFLTITAIGMTFVILSGGIDLSIGSMMSLVNVVSARWLIHAGFDDRRSVPRLILNSGRI